jgi:hypothetical protein
MAEYHHRLMEKRTIDTLILMLKQSRNERYEPDEDMKKKIVELYEMLEQAIDYKKGIKANTPSSPCPCGSCETINEITDFSLKD